MKNQQYTEFLIILKETSISSQIKELWQWF